MRCRSTASAARSDRGAVTAEFAVVLPAVVLVLLIALGALQLVGIQVRTQAAAAGAARSLGRGDTVSAQNAIAGLPAAALTSTSQGNLVCATVSAQAGLTPLAAFPISATSCSLRDGQ